MDPFKKNLNISRHKTPSTNYTSYSTPTLSPHSGYTFIFYDAEQEKHIALAEKFQNICLNYQQLILEKNELNNQCIKLITRENSCKLAFESLASLNTKDESINNGNLMDLEHFENLILNIEENNAVGKKELELLIRSYFDYMSKARDVNIILQAILNKSKQIERLKENYLKASIEKAKLLGFLYKIELGNNQFQKERELFGIEEVKIKNKGKRDNFTKKIVHKHKKRVKCFKGSVIDKDSDIYKVKIDLEDYEIKYKDAVRKVDGHKLRISEISSKVSAAFCELCKRKKEIELRSMVLIERQALIGNLCDELKQKEFMIKNKETAMAQTELQLLESFKILEKCIKSNIIM